MGEIMNDAEWHEFYLNDPTQIIIKGIIYTIAIGISIPIIGTFILLGKDTYKALKHFFGKF